MVGSLCGVVPLRDGWAILATKAVAQRGRIVSQQSPQAEELIINMHLHSIVSQDLREKKKKNHVLIGGLGDKDGFGES